MGQKACRVTPAFLWSPAPMKTEFYLSVTASEVSFEMLTSSLVVSYSSRCIHSEDVFANLANGISICRRNTKKRV